MEEIEGRMIDFNEALKLNDIEKLKEQIEIRKKLLELMVGNLYPPLVRGQIIDLRQRIIEIEKNGDS